MDFFNAQFFGALLAIVAIDLVLAGDNAIVIALAARKLPENLRKRAIVWGTMGAVVVRAALTVIVVWLLKIPGLMLAGGLLLFWIAYKLLTDDDGGEVKEHGEASTSFWVAMRTIIIADGVMGLDNMLAVAGASHGNTLLVVLGLIISIPIMVWGSTLILKLIDRFPIILYVGGAVLAWTACSMVIHEPMIAKYIEEPAWLSYVLHAVAIAAVLGTAWLVNRRNRQQAGERRSHHAAQQT
ncbi:MAG: TerC family protein [Burkholderiaceae bacterium]